MVKTCMQSAIYNPKTCIEYKRGFYHYKYSLDVDDSYTTIIITIINCHNWSDYQSSIVNNLSALIDTRTSNNVIV